MARKKTPSAAERAGDKCRIQFDFQRDSLEKLDELRIAVGAATRAEVIRRALLLFTECVEARDRGAKIILEERAGARTQILVL